MKKNGAFIDQGKLTRAVLFVIQFGQITVLL